MFTSFLLSLYFFWGGLNEYTTYDAAGRVIAQTDERGNTTTYTYDTAGRRTSVTDPLGNTTTFTYDKNGNQLTMTDAKGNTYAYEYDKNNRRTKTVFPDGTFTSITYDVLGRKIAETDQAGITTHFQYDVLGRLIKVTDALRHETTYAYDELGNRISQTDVNGNTTTWEYDSLGRVTKRTLPLGMYETMTYNAAGNLIYKTDFNGDTTTYAYDNNNRLILKTYPDSSTVSFAYILTGQRASILDPRGLTTYIYDLRDRLIQRTDPDGSVISYTYDEAGNRTSVTIPSGTTTYTFDALNRLLTVTDPDAGVTTYTYDAAGNRASVTYPNGTKAVYTYDTLNRLIGLKNKRSDDSIISSYYYTLGPSGNRIRVQENTGRVVDYTYDDLYRLTQESITDPLLGNRIITYSYDPVGNRLLKNEIEAGPTNYTYDKNDRLLTENGTLYTYDNNGNTISKTEGSDVTTYIYDYENRLVRAQTPTAVINYTYDADGIRVNSIVDGMVTNYLVDMNRDYAQVLEERDASSALLASYVYGDDLISMQRGGFVSFYHYDGNGNTRQLSDYSEIATDTYIYDAFGILLNRVGTTENNYLFTGEQYDVSIGFYYLRTRYYNQIIGRFLTIDLFNGDFFAPKTLHKYTYTYNDPINHIDPTGEFGITGVMASVSIGCIIVSLSAAIFPRSFIGRAYRAIGKKLPDALVIGAIGSWRKLRKIPKIGGFPGFTIPFGGAAGAQGGIEWVISIASAEHSVFGYLGGTIGSPSGLGLTIYAALVWRLYNLNHYKGMARGVGISGKAWESDIFFGGPSPIGSYWGIIIGRNLISGRAGFSAFFNIAMEIPGTRTQYSSMWPMVGLCSGLGAILGTYLGYKSRNVWSGVFSGLAIASWPMYKWSEPSLFVKFYFICINSSSSKRGVRGELHNFLFLWITL